MYAPAYNRAAGKEEILQFMKAHDFATLVTAGNGRLMATHLLFLFDGDAGNLMLLSHLARANPHWKHFGDAEAMVIFQGAHAYVSPVLYEKPLNVPTWNYMAVHAYGIITLMEREEEQLELLNRLVRHHDPAYHEKQFSRLPLDFIRSKMKGIVAFRIKVSRLEERFKLSQDKTDTEKQNIMSSLSSSEDPQARGIAKAMHKLYGTGVPDVRNPHGKS